MSKRIIQIIKEGEGLTTEFKRTIDSAFKIAKTIVSFANTSGGHLLVGVSDSGGITGVGSELKELKKLETAALLIEPKVIVQIKTLLIDGMKVMQVDVAESPDKPHYAVNEKDARIIYIRVKDKSIPIPKLLMQTGTDADLEKLLASRHVKTLITYLREQDAITAKGFSRMINISEKRAERMLHELAEKQVLLKISKNKPETFSLKWSK